MLVWSGDPTSKSKFDSSRKWGYGIERWCWGKEQTGESLGSLWNNRPYVLNTCLSSTMINGKLFPVLVLPHVRATYNSAKSKTLFGIYNISTANRLYFARAKIIPISCLSASLSKADFVGAHLFVDLSVFLCIRKRKIICQLKSWFCRRWYANKYQLATFNYC